MKKIISIILVLVMLLGLAACGSSKETGKPAGDGSKKKITEPDGPGGMEEALRFDFSGCWVCSGLRSGDTEMSAEELQSLLGMSPDEILSLEILDDFAVLSYMGQGLRISCERSETEDALTLSIAPGLEGEGSSITLRLESDGRISYDEQLGTLLLSRADYRPDSLARQLHLYFLPSYTAGQTCAMSNYMTGSSFLRSGDTFFGQLFTREYHYSCFASFALGMDANNVWPEISNAAALIQNCSADCLAECDGMIYFMLYDHGADDSSVCRIGKDGSGFEMLIDDAVEYMQIVGDRIFYTNDDYTYCSADLNGGSVRVELDKEIYYPYQVQPGLLMYQDDADNESLHMFDLSTGFDERIALGRVYAYGILDNCLYFAKIDDEAAAQTGERICRLYRMDLSLPYPEYSEDGEILFAYQYEVSDENIGPGVFVYPSKLYSHNYGMADPDKWDTLADDSYSGRTEYFMYCDEDWYLIKNYDDEGYVTSISFYSAHNAHGSPYLYVDDIA